MTSPSLSLGLRKTQSTGDIEDSVVIKPRTITSKETISILRSPTTTPKRPLTPPSQSMILLEPVIEDDFDDRVLASKLKEITACDMELLLSLETQARMDCQEEKEKKQLQSNMRPSKIKFALPITPPRSKSPDTTPFFHATRQRRWSLPDDKKKCSKRPSRWSKLIKQQQQEEAQRNKQIQTLDSHVNSSSISSNSSHSSSEEEEDPILLGSKVKLFKRPLPIIGIVKYVGKVHFDAGEWLGIELSSRVGNTDGIIDNVRYFQTNLHCGIFVKKEDTVKIK
ncbi:CAP Gly-rich domain-containing protein [Mucor mucedo]|uniref:CAP Gly-rich domain-containing protein n=1 Tax=Mucor mucedo TaxID=29922 RepID=UPI00222019DC|nr:CAP Gly-rich domain-containing protein [Mucor mucedo]KAI7887651.1 CAP Gly-rich domain-containing protein [Mucor mucedo]